MDVCVFLSASSKTNKNPRILNFSPVRVCASRRLPMADKQLIIQPIFDGQEHITLFHNPTVRVFFLLFLLSAYPSSVNRSIIFWQLHHPHREKLLPFHYLTSPPKNRPSLCPTYKTDFRVPGSNISTRLGLDSRTST